ncbi:helix-turn-helix domain-containing protein [Streptomyces platensis]|uniref:helix-turn-helix domain-containing protein n=1 Tax=Streptomyces platensis TaxID=58346 RepID=UPI0038701D84
MPSSTRYLREDERIHIADRLREKASVRAIAAELGRSPSTISREIRRNGIPLCGDHSRWVYRPHAAQRRAGDRRPRPKPGKIGQKAELRDFIQAHLAMRWSPEQICHALRSRFPDRPEMHVVHETIYQALYVQGLAAGRARGRVGGRPGVATEEVIRAARDLLPDPGRSITSIAKLLGVSAGTLYHHTPDLRELRAGAVPRQLEAPTQ